MKNIGKWIVDCDQKYPFIILGVIAGVFLWTFCQQMKLPYADFMKTYFWKNVTNHYGIAIFFASLGAHIKIKEIKTAGTFVTWTIIGGMLIPPVFTYMLTHNFYLSLGAIATDVAFSLTALKVSKRITQAGIITFLTTGLILLGVGDDAGGVAVAASIYADNISILWLVGGLLLLLVCFFIGEKGNISVLYKVAKTYVPENPDQTDQLDKFKKIIFNIRLSNTTVWIILGVMNIFILNFAGIEWILGACLVFILAPLKVKKRLDELFKPIIPIVLLLFGFINGSIDVFDSSSWGYMTFAFCFGGVFGKQIGIFFFGLIGRYILRRSKPDNQYAKLSNTDIYFFALPASVNGVVAIIFVNLAARNFPHLVNPELVTQATLGYFLTVPLVLLLSTVLSALFKHSLRNSKV